MKKYIIIISLSICVIVSGVLIYTSIFDSNIGKQSLDIEIKSLKSMVNELENTIQANQLEISKDNKDLTKIEELKIQLSTLENKLNTYISDMGILQNKVSLQTTNITSLQTTIANLEKKDKGIIGTWKGTRNLSDGTLQNIQYVFKEDGTVVYNFGNTTNTYIYSGSMITTRTDYTYNKVMFYTITSDNTMSIYYYFYNNSYRTDNLIKQ